MITLCSRVDLKTMLYDERSETKGFIRGLLHFDDGSELHIREFVDVSTDTPVLRWCCGGRLPLRGGTRHIRVVDTEQGGFVTHNRTDSIAVEGTT